MRDRGRSPCARILTGDAAELHQPCPAFDFARDPEHDSALDRFDLADTLFRLLRARGVLSLSAPQIGVIARVFVIRDGWQRIECFNPEIIERSREIEWLEESCLSFPGTKATIARSRWIHVAFHDAHGDAFKATFVGRPAQLFQHELDHLVGRTIADRRPTTSVAHSRRRS